jgi:hypothetical protein
MGSPAEGTETSFEPLGFDSALRTCLPTPAATVKTPRSPDGGLNFLYDRMTTNFGGADIGGADVCREEHQL